MRLIKYLVMTSIVVMITYCTRVQVKMHSSDINRGGGFIYKTPVGLGYDTSNFNTTGSNNVYIGNGHKNSCLGITACSKRFPNVFKWKEE